jgi:hypothetical protein
VTTTIQLEEPTDLGDGGDKYRVKHTLIICFIIYPPHPHMRVGARRNIE